MYTLFAELEPSQARSPILGTASGPPRSSGQTFAQTPTAANSPQQSHIPSPGSQSPTSQQCMALLLQDAAQRLAPATAAAAQLQSRLASPTHASSSRGHSQSCGADIGDSGQENAQTSTAASSQQRSGSQPRGRQSPDCRHLESTVPLVATPRLTTTATVTAMHSRFGLPAPPPVPGRSREPDDGAPASAGDHLPSQIQLVPRPRRSTN